MAVLIVLSAFLTLTVAGTETERIGFSPGGAFLAEDEPTQQRDTAHMVEAGARWIRLDIDWSRIELTPRAFDWSATDRAVRTAREAGLDVIGLVSYTPAWARPAGTSNTWPPDDASTFAEFAATAAARYAEEIDVWEVWNEPNLITYWSSGPDPDRYTRLLTATSGALRRLDPHITILLGGLASVPDAPPGRIDLVTFVRLVYQHNGGRSFDGVSAHPYTYPALPSRKTGGAFLRLDDLHALMTERGDGDKGVWVTEFGAPTGTSATAVSVDTQAASLADGFALARSRPWIRSFLVFSLRDSGHDPEITEQHFGVRDADDAPKPGWFVYSREVTGR